VVFEFAWGGAATDPRSSGTIRRHFADRRYAAYDRVGGPKMVHACCWAHARRKFFEAAKLNPSDARPRAWWRGSMTVRDRRSGRELNLDHAARHALRLERAKPLLEVIRERSSGPRRFLAFQRVGKAANYTLSLWRKLTRFLTTPSWN